MLNFDIPPVAERRTVGRALGTPPTARPTFSLIRRPLSDIVVDRPSSALHSATGPLLVHPVGCRIIAAEDVHPHVRIVTLRRSSPGAPVFRAGQAVMVYLPAGRPRPLFPATAPERPELTLHIRHHPAGGAAADVGRTLRVGDALWIAEAVGDAYLRPEIEGPIVLAADIRALPAVLAIMDASLTARPDGHVNILLAATDESEVYDEGRLLDRQRDHRNLRVAIALSSPRKASRRPVMTLAHLVAAAVRHCAPAAAYVFAGRGTTEDLGETFAGLGLSEILFCHSVEGVSLEI